MAWHGQATGRPRGGFPAFESAEAWTCDEGVNREYVSDELVEMQRGPAHRVEQSMGSGTDRPDTNTTL
jgi:hypothetical protein